MPRHIVNEASRMWQETRSVTSASPSHPSSTSSPSTSLALLKRSILSRTSYDGSVVTTTEAIYLPTSIEDPVVKKVLLHTDVPTNHHKYTEPLPWRRLLLQTPTAAVDCFPNVTKFCTHEQFEKWLAAYKWTRVANNYLTGLWYNDTFRAVS